jgi:hypothetical protein
VKTREAIRRDNNKDKPTFYLLLFARRGQKIKNGRTIKVPSVYRFQYEFEF